MFGLRLDVIFIYFSCLLFFLFLHFFSLSDSPHWTSKIVDLAIFAIFEKKFFHVMSHMGVMVQWPPPGGSQERLGGGPPPPRPPPSHQ